MFKHPLGALVITKVAGIKGILTARSENLYGCNRYYVQPRADKDQKVADGWWVDEDDVKITGKGVAGRSKDTGGPMDKNK